MLQAYPMLLNNGNLEYTNSEHRTEHDITSTGVTSDHHREDLETFEDTQVVIKNFKSKTDMQHNGLQNNTEIIWGERKCSRRIKQILLHTCVKNVAYNKSAVHTVLTI